MNRCRSLLLFLLSIVTLAAARVIDDAYSLTWKPKEGQVLDYSMRLETKAEEIAVVFTGNMNLKVTKVETNGDYTLEMLFKDVAVSVDGKEEKMDGDAKPEVQKYNAKGERLDAKKPDDEESGDDPFGGVMNQITDFNPPGKDVKPGDKWTTELKADDKQKLPPAKIEYEAIDAYKNVEDKYDALKITFTYKQTQGQKPITAEGAFYIDIHDGSIVKVVANIENIKFDEETPSTAKVTVDRK